jgi:tetratricopeptide (TPR) repeat protein
LIAAGVAMLLATGLLTRSFGFLVGLFLLAASWLFIYHRRVMWRLAPVVLILALVGGVFYSIREGGIATANPVSLRAMNWVTGWTIFAAYPMGTGLNTYGIMYSQYRLPGSNETQYAHNTLLQLLSELGYIALIAGAGVLLLVMGAWHRGELRRLSPYLLLAFAVWTVHNLIDINVYFPSLGVVGAVLLATLLKRQAATPQAVPKGAIGVLVSLGAVTLIFSSLVMVSSELQVRAQGEFDENKLQEAARTLETATALMPFNSSLFHDFGDINLNLYHKHKDYKRLDLATRSFQRAIALSPNKAGSHLGLSLCFSSANRIEDARAQLRVAERLYPDSTYVQAVARLLDKRKAGITN